MRKAILAAFGVAAVIGLTGCGSTPGDRLTQATISERQSPDFNGSPVGGVNGTQTAYAAYSGQPVGSKVGKSCASEWLWGIFTSGQASIGQAASSGGIGKIHLAEYRMKDGWFVNELCMVVYGD